MKGISDASSILAASTNKKPPTQWVVFCWCASALLGLVASLRSKKPGFAADGVKEKKATANPRVQIFAASTTKETSLACQGKGGFLH